MTGLALIIIGTIQEDNDLIIEGIAIITITLIIQQLTYFIQFCVNSKFKKRLK